MVKRRVLGLWLAGFVELIVFAFDPAIDAFDESINPNDENWIARRCKKAAAGTPGLIGN